MKWLVVVAGLAACGGRGQVREETAPNLAELRAVLAKHASHAFTAADIERGCPADQTLGAYVDMLVTYGSPSSDGDLHKLTGGCSARFPQAPAPIDPARDEAYWYCVLDSYTSDPAGESPWHYEIRVRIRRADRQLDLTTMAFPGAA